MCFIAGLFFVFFFSLVRADSQVLPADFDRQIGKGLSYWNFVEEKDLPWIQKWKRLYERNQHLLLHNEGMDRIPRVIHFIWIGPKNFPIISVKNIRTWIAFHPGWKIKFWTDRDRPCPCEEMEKVFVKDFSFSHLKELYETSNNWGEKSDLLRYEILLQEGGLYVDHDANALRSFESLHKAFDFYGGLEVPHGRLSGFSVTAGIGLMGAKPFHPILKKTIEILLESRLKAKNYLRKEEKTLNFTYLALTLALQQYPESAFQREILFPASYFFAREGLFSLYSHHFFCSFWLNDREDQLQENTKKRVEKIQKELHQMLRFFLFGGGILLGCWIFLRKKRSSCEKKF